MLFNIPFPVWCVLSFFYGYGAFALLTGKVWNRWTGKIETGLAARLGGVVVIGVGVLMTVGVTHPEKQNEVAATLFLWIINWAVIGVWIRRRADERNEFLRLPSVRKSKRKRKRNELVS